MESANDVVTAASRQQHRLFIPTEHILLTDITYCANMAERCESLFISSVMLDSCWRQNLRSLQHSGNNDLTILSFF